jgi:Ala-tRNA(Pro) deacylase
LNHRQIDINRLAKVLGCARLSFGRPELLEQVLGVAPGGVTPFALIDDRAHRVQPLLDLALLACDRLNYHPLTDAATTAIRGGRCAQGHGGVRSSAQHP